MSVIFVKNGKFPKIGETWINNFKVAASLCFKARLTGKPLI